MSKVCFTIVAKNYIPMANALGDSIKKVHNDIPFFIIVADEEDDVIDFNTQRYPIVRNSDLEISQLDEMAFKYNVTEFCTSLKPFAFAYFFKKGFQKAIYFDPDIYVYGLLDSIYEKLSHHSIVVTPHVCTMEKQYTGLVPEGMLMHVGIFNFGFCAISNSENGQRIIEWWQDRLKEQCYADKIDGLHTDQKWIDFLPSLIDDMYIERGLGYNVAIWNWHERELYTSNGKFWVKNRINGSNDMPLIFFHYSNFSFSQAADLNKFKPKYMQKFSDINDTAQYYANVLAEEEIGKYSSLYSYTYATYKNKDVITHFHRRFFRRLLESGHTFESPFSVDKPNSFYGMMKKSNLLNTSTTVQIGKQNEENLADFSTKLYYLQKIAKFIKFIIGIERYSLLCKFAQRFVRPENQVFLISDDIVKEIPFYNENRYINWK